MNNTSKVFFIITSIFIFSFLLFTTYVTGSYSSFQKPEIIENIENENINISKIDNYNDIYIISGNTNINENSINLDDGIYIFDINFLNKNISININGYNIIPKSEGIFILNNLNSNDVLIYSLNSTVSLEIINDSSEVLNNVIIYPNNLISGLNPRRNNQTKNADYLRMTQILDFYFIKDKIKNLDNFSSGFKKLISSNNEEYLNKFKTNIEFISKNKISKESKLEEFYSSNFGTVVGEEIIKKYSDLFLNKTKKSIYYKNIILRTFADLLETKGNGNKEITLITETYEELKEVSPESANEIKKYLNYYFKSIFGNNSFTREKKSKINELVFKLNKTKSELINNDLGRAFYDYNFKGLNLNSEIIKENDEYFKEINNNEYYSSNIQNIFLEMIESKNYNIFDINNILSIYLDSSNKYFISENKKEIETGINNYIEVYKNIEPILKDTFFEKERDENKLLVLKEIEKSNDEIKSLEENISLLYKRYNENSHILNDKELKNKLNKQIVGNKFKLFQEYFIALKDFEDYIAKYDENKKDLLYGDSVNDSSSSSLDTNKISNFLKTFKGLSFNNLEIKIRNYNYCKNPIAENIDNSDEYCYEIKNLVVGNDLISFMLSPFESNKIDKLVINGDDSINKGSYKLDKQKEVLGEKYKTASSEEKNKFLFENFFIVLLSEQKTNSGIEIIDNDDDSKIDNEDNVIKVFKRNKLLGTKGDFYSIREFLEIKYDDLKVTSNGNNYDIFIQNSSFEKSLEGNINVKGILNSSYSFNPDHSFINPELTFIDRNGYKLFNGNEIKIEGKYNVEKINSELDILFKNIQDLEKITRKISIKYGNNYSIKYFKETNIYQIDIEGNIVELKGNIVTKTIFSGIESDINESINNFNFQ